MDGFHVCGQTIGYDFVHSCASEGDVRRLSSYKVDKLAKDYRHIMGCEDCLRRTYEALGEFVFGNDKFDMNLFNVNVTLLENMLKVNLKKFKNSL